MPAGAALACRRTGELQVTRTSATTSDFDTMALAVEGRVQLLVSREGQHYGHFSTLVGYVRDEYLLVTGSRWERCLGPT